MQQNERKPYLIGINGEIGCGKTTAANYLEYKYGYFEYMFAEPLKQIAITLGFEHHQVFGTQEEKLEINKFWGISGRKFLQVFGSEVCRDFVPKALPDMKFNGLTMWVRLFEKFYDENEGEAVVVSDVRFEDESNVIKKLGGYVVRIVRPSVTTTTATAATTDTIVTTTTNTASHVSELQADKIKPHVIIRNDGTRVDLYRKLDQLILMIDRGILDVDDGMIYI